MRCIVRQYKTRLLPPGDDDHRRNDRPRRPPIERRRERKRDEADRFQHTHRRLLRIESRQSFHDICRQPGLASFVGAKFLADACYCCHAIYNSIETELGKGIGMARTVSIWMLLGLVVGFGVPAWADVVIGGKPQSVLDTFHPRPAGITVENWVTGLVAPWSLVFLPDGRALVSERPGRIRLIRKGQLQDDPYAVFETTRGASGAGDFFLNLFARGEGGLMGLAVHPDFSASPFIYAMYTWRGREGVRNRIVRLRDRGDHATFDKIIFGGVPGALFHNGGRIAFGPDGMLYAATGEIFEMHMAQDLGALGGKVLRIDPDGGIPDDNPFPGFTRLVVWAPQSARPRLAPRDG